MLNDPARTEAGADSLPAARGEGSGRWMQVRHSTASANIVAQIRDRLFRGDLTPGDFLGTERSLGEEFGVSRLTMRDALRILEAGGIVEVKVGKSGGVRVAHAQPERFADALAVQLMLEGASAQELFEAQMAIEMQAVRLAAGRADADDIAMLEDHLARVRAARGDSERFVIESLAFHMAVVTASHNRVLIAQFQALRHLSWRVLARSHSAGKAVTVIRRHEALLAAVRAGDPAAAAEAVQTHVSSVMRSVLNGTA